MTKARLQTEAQLDSATKMASVDCKPVQSFGTIYPFTSWQQQYYARLYSEALRRHFARLGDLRQILESRNSVDMNCPMPLWPKCVQTLDMSQSSAKILSTNVPTTIYSSATCSSEAAKMEARDSDSPSSTTDDDEFEAALIGRPFEPASSVIGREDELSDESVNEKATTTSTHGRKKYARRLVCPLVSQYPRGSGSCVERGVVAIDDNFLQTKDERRERKKAQNRAAAIRYRQKKTDCQSSAERTLHRLAKRNESLRCVAFRINLF